MPESRPKRSCLLHSGTACPSTASACTARPWPRSRGPTSSKAIASPPIWPSWRRPGSASASGRKPVNSSRLRAVMETGPYVTGPSEAASFLREAEAAVEFDPAFPADPFAP